MLCARPFRGPSGEFGCGQCIPCRINRRRMWTGRLELERGLHYQSIFATLTFSSPGPYSVEPRHLQLFMKRLRRGYPAPLRFFGVGEYGEVNQRPHYHVAIFGMSMVDHRWDSRGVVCGGPVFDAWWPWGNVHVGELNRDSAQYICGYVTKKWTKVDTFTESLLDGRHPEFVRMSNRPGIGAGFARGAAAGLSTLGGSAGLAKNGDVPSELRVDGKKFPLGRYLRRKLREEVGWSADTPKEVLKKIRIEESALPDEQRWIRERKRSASALKAASRAAIGKSKRTL